MRIAVLDDYQGVALASAPWDRLPREVDVVTFREHVADPDDVARMLQGFSVVVAMRERTPFPADLLASLPDLRLLVTTGMRNAAIDVDAARAQGVTVCGTDSDLTATVELTWALILAASRHLVREEASMRTGGWQRRIGRGLHGQTLGLIGLGGIGRRMASVAAAFGMHVLAWSQNLTPEAAEQAGAVRVEKAELLRASDIVSLHLRLSERTRGIIGRAELEMMRPTALLVNTARGPLVDEQALLAALASGTIAAAALDTYAQEPLPPDHPLRQLPNTLLTPHLGYVTEQTYALFYSQAVDDIVAFLQGRPVRVLGGS